MYTFFTDQYRKQVSKEYRKRLFFITAIGFCGIFIVACGFSVPGYILLDARKAAIESRAGHTRYTLPDTSPDETIVKDITLKITTLSQLSTETAMVSLVDRIVTVRTPSIHIKGISLKRGTSAGSISISGIADTRDALVAFSKSLQGDPTFTNVVLPVATLAKSKDIGFSITIDSTF